MDSAKTSQSSQRRDTSHGASQRERTFLANAAHELRTPLHSASGFLEMALDGMAGPLNERQQEMLGYVRLALGQLGVLLEDVLFIARADGGELTPHLTNVAPTTILARAIENVREQADEKNVTLTQHPGEAPATIRADGERVREGLAGLLRGALTLAASGGEITIATSADDSLLRFTVTVEGVRLDANDLRHLFDRFYQPRPLGADRSAHLGLALVIAQTTAGWHGGCARADMAPDGASLILSYELPLNGS